MTLNATGTISANSGVAGTNIALEFGWTPPFSLATKTPRSSVPTSAFNLSAFYGKSNSVLGWTGANALLDINIQAIDGSGLGHANCNISFPINSSNITSIVNADGVTEVRPDSWGVTSGWGDYSIRAVGTHTITGTRALTRQTTVFGTVLSITGSTVDTGYLALGSIARTISSTANCSTSTLPASAMTTFSGTIYIRHNTTFTEISKLITIKSLTNWAGL